MCSLGGETDQSGVLGALLEAWCFGSMKQVPLAGKRYLLSYNLNVLEEVSPPQRMRKSDMGTKSHLCECPGEGKNMALWGNCKYFTGTGAKGGGMKDWGEVVHRPMRKMFLGTFCNF